MHKTKQKRDRNRTTTSLVLDSSMLRGRRKFGQKPADLVAFKLSVFESRQISFLKIFLVSSSSFSIVSKEVLLYDFYKTSYIKLAIAVLIYMK